MKGVMSEKIDLPHSLVILTLPTELVNFKRKRVAAFRKNLIEMSELEIKHARVSSLLTLHFRDLPVEIDLRFRVVLLASLSDLTGHFLKILWFLLIKLFRTSCGGINLKRLLLARGFQVWVQLGLVRCCHSVTHTKKGHVSIWVCFWGSWTL